MRLIFAFLIHGLTVCFLHFRFLKRDSLLVFEPACCWPWLYSIHTHTHTHTRADTFTVLLFTARLNHLNGSWNTPEVSFIHLFIYWRTPSSYKNAQYFFLITDVCIFASKCKCIHTEKESVCVCVWVINHC